MLLLLILLTELKCVWELWFLLLLLSFPFKRASIKLYASLKNSSSSSYFFHKWFISECDLSRKVLKQIKTAFWVDRFQNHLLSKTRDQNDVMFVTIFFESPSTVCSYEFSRVSSISWIDVRVSSKKNKTSSLCLPRTHCVLLVRSEQKKRKMEETSTTLHHTNRFSFSLIYTHIDEKYK